MKYMLLIYSSEDAWTKDEWNACVAESMGICKELSEKGQLISASPLHPVASGSTVRVRDGKQSITTGPFAETTEQLGGFYLIEVEDLDLAIAIACRLPPAKKGTIEIRPVYHLDDLPDEKWSILQRADMHLSASGPQSIFMLLCYDDEVAWEREGKKSHREAMNKAVQLTHQLDSEDRFVSASPLHPSSTATCVRIRNGKRMLTDGPFAETREVLGGYYVILVEDQAAALSIAAQHPGVHLGAVEVRELVDVNALNACCGLESK